MKLAGALILLNAVLAQGRPRSLEEIDLAMNAAEIEVAAHMDEVIKHAKASEGWDITDVVSNVDVGVSEVLDKHGIGGAMKEKAMDHLDNKLFKMLEEISEEKELNVIRNEEQVEEELEEEIEAKHNVKAMKVSEAGKNDMDVAESEVAKVIDTLRVRLEKGNKEEWFDFGRTEEVHKAYMVVIGILEEHGIEGDLKEQAMDHLNMMLSKLFEKTSAEKKGGSVAKELDDAINAEAMKAAESEVAAHMDAVIERAKATEGWVISDVVRNVGAGVNEILDEHGIEGAKKEQAMDHLDNKLFKMLEVISEEKEVDEKKVAKEFDDAINAEAMNAAESEVAAHMDAVIERAKATEGWVISDVVQKVGVGVNEILDEHGIEGAKKEQAMDHLDNKLFKMLEEISEEKEGENDITKVEINF